MYVSATFSHKEKDGWTFDLVVALTTPAKARPYRIDGSRRLDYTLLIVPIDGMERGSGQFFNFFAAALPSSDKLPNIK